MDEEGVDPARWRAVSAKNTGENAAGSNAWASEVRWDCLDLAALKPATYLSEEGHELIDEGVVTMAVFDSRERDTGNKGKASPAKQGKAKGGGRGAGRGGGKATKAKKGGGRGRWG